MALVTNGGKLLTNADGLATGTPCCCGGASSCPSSYPEMLCTVFDADYAGGNITWAGNTWTQAEVQAGAQKTACPVLYDIRQYTYSGFNYFNHVWLYAYASGGDLAMKRTIKTYAGTFQSAYQSAFIRGARSWKYANGPYGAPTFTGSAAPLTGANVVGEPMVNKTNYNTFTAGFFGSHTVSGVKYTWAKGNGW